MLSPILCAQVWLQPRSFGDDGLRYAKGIPICIIYRLQMNVRTKVALCFLMGLGVLYATHSTSVDQRTDSVVAPPVVQLPKRLP